MTYEGMALSDIEMLNVMSVARETGALVMVHAENYERHPLPHRPAGARRQNRAAFSRHVTANPGRARSDPSRHRTGRTDRRTIVIVHVSNGEAMEEIARGRKRGLKIYGETCPQYLMLTEKDMDGLNMEGAKYVCSPPPRDKSEPGRVLGRHAARHLHLVLLRPLPVQI